MQGPFTGRSWSFKYHHLDGHWSAGLRIRDAGNDFGRGLANGRRLLLIIQIAETT